MMSVRADKALNQLMDKTGIFLVYNLNELWYKENSVYNSIKSLYGMPPKNYDIVLTEDNLKEGVTLDINHNEIKSILIDLDM